MATISPIASQHHQAEAATLSYGSGADGTPVIDVVGTFGDLELEYAALRKGCVLLDQPHRGVIEVKGRERLEFLNRMLTQELKNLPPFSSRRSFWLNRKGRIDADFRVIDLPSRTLLDVDVLALKRGFDGLSSYIISEDVELRDITQETHRLALHGPTATALVSALARHASGADASGPAFAELLAGRACVVQVAGHEVVIDRDDSAGEIGLELTMPVGAAVAVYDELLQAGSDPDADVPHPERDPSRPQTLGSRVRLRPAGWLAYNIARIEAGTPLYNIDFGADSLPAESGVIDDRVSFKKGCYLGQEIVARMHARGHPKQCLVAIRLADNTPTVASRENPDVHLPHLPVTGAPVFAVPAGGDASVAPPVIGAVTSSTISPMLGARPACLAQVKWEYVAPGTKLMVDAEGTMVAATVQPSLAFWKRG
ncbi:MAG: glycine cleavage T C-terminal barrel domain-containing protein [Planctomycetota bacterium]|nr:glycine cleavage T C-terminal barrel domain-containing protein [Planctomycetota bacterium]